MVAMDWTYDLFVEDMQKYGVEDENSENYNAYFVARVKKLVESFKTEWLANHDGHWYDRYEGYVGDAFERECLDGFSDFYKDAYGQRPHLANWYYIRQMGLPHRQDTIRTFCASPVEDAMEAAKNVREGFND